MPFKKNHKLSKGRPQGSKNKATQKVRDNFQKLVEVNMKQLQKDIDSLEPYERIKVILQISKFVLPGLRAIEVQQAFVEQPLFPDRDYPMHKLSDATLEELSNISVEME